MKALVITGTDESSDSSVSTLVIESNRRLLVPQVRKGDSASSLLSKPSTLFRSVI